MNALVVATFLVTALFTSEMFFRNCKRFGRQSWITAAIVLTEVLICMKYEPQTLFKPLPNHIALFWVVGAAGLMLFSLWKFYLKTHLFLHHHSKKSPKHVATKNGAQNNASENLLIVGSGAASNGLPRPSKSRNKSKQS